MPPIITITFSPCIDKSTSVDSLIPEKKLKCAAPELDPGGGGINVARAIIKLGGKALAIFPSGGYTGKFFNHLIEREKVPTIIIECVNETRENIIVMDEATNKQYRFGMPGTELSRKEWEQCLVALEKIKDVEFIIASGSLPPGVPSDIYARISKIAAAKNAKLIVDASTEALKHALVEGVYMIKPNLGELAGLIGRERIDENDLPVIARDIIQKFKCEIVVISLGKKGAMLVTNNEIFKTNAPETPVKSTVGAGDSMVAGIVHSLSNGLPLEQALQYGVACGTAATMNPGTELCDPDDVDRLYTLMKDKS